MAKHPPEPNSLDERLQAKARLLSDRLFERRLELAEATGNPIKSEEIDRKSQYKDLIASPEMLFNSIAGAAIVGRDGKLRISTKMAEAFRDLSDAS